MLPSTDLDLTAVVVCRDDEEVIGHQLRRLHAHLCSLGLRFEILAVDESSRDNTLALLSFMRAELSWLSVIPGVAVGRGYVRGAELARGQAVLLLDGRECSPLSALGFALSRIAGGYDGMLVHGRYLVFRRTRSFALFDALAHHRSLGSLGNSADLHARFLRRARTLGLRIHVAASKHKQAHPWRRLREALLVPLASRAWW